MTINIPDIPNPISLPPKYMETLNQTMQRTQAIQKMLPKSDTPSLFEMSEKLGETIASAPQVNPAKWVYTQLMELVEEFESELNDEQEIGLKIISLGNAEIYHVLNIDYRKPYLLVFHCLTQNGIEATLIQNYSQLNFLLIALPKLDSKKSARRIGFAMRQTEDDLADGNSNS